MIQIKPFSDNRFDGFCIFCGGEPETRDHIPSKVFLDSPFPSNLPVVSCCLKCNESFSLDEEYVACLIECVVCGTTEIEKLQREKIKRILNRKKPLRQRLTESIIEIDGEKSFKFEEKRLDNVILKLARGHAKYEFSEVKFREPSSYRIEPIITMSENEADNFFSLPIVDILPELGSRAMQKLLINSNDFYHHWTVVQEGNYMYSVISNLDCVSVKIVIRDYLAVEVIWND